VALQSDITRYARSSKEVGWQQGVGFWVTKVISIFLAIFSASFLYSRFGGTVIWNVWDQLDLILTEQWGPASRAGVFFIALGFAFSSTVTNAYANSE
jgi:NCS1 family nucleobase:cation symporter-1